MTTPLRLIITLMLATSALVGCNKTIEFQIDAKGRYAYYAVTVEGAPARLERTDLKTGEIDAVSAPLAKGESLGGYAITPKGRYVVYQTFKQELEEPGDPRSDIRLWNTKTGDLSEFDTELIGDEVIMGCRFDEKSRTLILQTAREVDGDPQGGSLYALNTKTGAMTDLTPDLVDTSMIFTFDIDARFRTLIYQTTELDNSKVPDVELFILDLKTGISTEIDPTPSEDLSIISATLGPKARFIVFQGVRVDEFDELTESALYQYSIKSGDITLLTDDKFLEVSVVPPSYSIDDRGRTLLFESIDPTDGTAVGIHRVDLKTNAVTDMIDPILEGRRVERLTLDPKGRFALYLADRDIENANELYVWDFKQDGPTKVSDSVTASGEVFYDYALEAKRRTVTYRARSTADSSIELYTARLKDGEITPVNAPLAPGGNVRDFTLGPRGRSTIYRADQDEIGTPELYVSSVKKKQLSVTKLSGALTNDGEVNDTYRVDPKGRFVVYAADQDTTDVTELYRADIKGGVASEPGATVKVSGTLEEDESVVDN